MADAILPDSIGNGTYTFTYKMPVDVGQPGNYYFDSYIAEFVGDELVSYSCANVYSFIVDDLTGIKEAKSEKWAGACYTLDGQKIVNRKLPKGICILGGKKVIVQ